MLRISKQADYGLLLLALLARRSAKDSRSARDLADESGIPIPMAGKVLKILARAGIVAATRGASGGYLLGRPPAAITVLEIIDALDGPVGITECSRSHHEQECEQAHRCPVSDPWRRINDEIRGALERVSLADMVCPVLDPVSAFTGRNQSKDTRPIPAGSFPS